MNTEQAFWARPTGRRVGVAFGLATQMGFLITVGFLFVFLRYGRPSDSLPWVWRDSWLALQFAVIHSLTLHPRTRRWLSNYLPRELYGCLFCVFTCLCLAAVFVGWRGSPRVIWQMSGVAAVGMVAGFYLSWLALLYSLAISGLGYQTGLTPWWYWVRRQPAPRRSFVVHGAYRWIRHPIYLSFLGLIWFTPRMTWDHALLTAIWTVYIFVGSYLKDERLAFYVGAEYRRYQADVSGYPFLVWGPLARRRFVESVASPDGASRQAA